jgi:cell division protein FtsB
VPSGPIPAQRQASSHVVYTPRAIAFGVMFIAVLMLAAVPMREWLAQRSEIARLDADRAATQARVDALTAQRQSFNNPQTIEQLARDRLHYEFPGETSVLVPAPSATPAPKAVKHGRAQVTKQDNSTWYSRLWSSTTSVSP